MSSVIPIKGAGYWKVRQTDEVRLHQAMLDIKTITGASKADVIRHTATVFVQSARAATPKSRPWAEARENPAYVKGKRGTMRWLIVRYDNEDREKLIPSKTKRSEVAKIGTRGAMIGAWNGALRKMHAGVATGGSLPGEKVGRKYSEVVDRVADANARLEVANQVRYAQIVDQGGARSPPHNVMAKGGRKGLSRLKRELDHIGEEWATRWRRPSAGRSARSRHAGGL